MIQEYGEKLKSFSKKSGYLFVNPNKAIYEELLKSSSEKYLLDQIHPNAGEGIKLYSKNILLTD